MQYYLQLNNPGSGNLSVHRYSAGADDLSIGKLIKVNYRGQERGGWFIENISYDEVKSGEHAGEWKNVTGRGAMAVLADGIVYPESGSTDSTRIFTNVTMASMLLTFIAEAKARGCFPDLRTDFSAVLDSTGEPWTDLSTLSFNVDSNLLDVINQLVDLGLEFDFKLDWIVGDYVLYAYQTSIGSDVSASVVFRPGLNCAEVNNKQESGELKNALRVTYNGGATEITDAASIAAYRRREAPFQVGNVTTSGGAVQMATPELTAKKDPQLSISIKVEDAAGNPRAFVDYKVGDWVGYDAGDGAAPALYRVRGMMLDFGENDKYAVITVDLNSIRLERELQTAIALRKLGSGVIGSSTSSPMPEGVSAAISSHNLDTTSHATRTLSGGDLAGTIGIPTVAKLRGAAIKNPLVLVDKNLLKWSHANQQFEPGFVDWLEVEGKPSTFAPSAHNHGSLELDDGSAGTPAVRFGLDTNTGFYRESADKLVFVANGQNSLGIDGTSGVGRFVIGDGTPVSRLQIFDDNDVAASGIVLGGNAASYVQMYKLAAKMLYSNSGLKLAGSLYIDNDLTNPVTFPASAVDNRVVFFDGVTGKKFKDSGLTLSGSNTGDETTSTIKTKLGIATLSGSNTGDQTLPVKAAGAEINTGTDDAKFATAKALKDSNIVGALNLWPSQTIRDHFMASSIDAYWSGWSTTPAAITYNYRSHMLLANPSAAQKDATCFLYKSETPTAPGNIETWVAVDSNQVEGGLRIDNGSDDTFIEFYIKGGVGTYLLYDAALFVKYCLSGGAITTTQLSSPFPGGQAFNIKIQRNSTTKFYLYAAKDVPSGYTAGVTFASAWTPTRHGIFVRNLADSGPRPGYFHWYGTSF